MEEPADSSLYIFAELLIEGEPEVKLKKKGNMIKDAIEHGIRHNQKLGDIPAAANLNSGNCILSE